MNMKLYGLNVGNYQGLLLTAYCLLLAKSSLNEITGRW
jgi:hypothetical protein